MKLTPREAIRLAAAAQCSTWPDGGPFAAPALV